MKLADNPGAGEPDDGGGNGVAAGGAHAHHVVAGLQDRGGPGLVIGGEVGQVEGDRDLLALAGGELSGLPEARERLVGLVEPAGRDRDVDLDDLLAGAPAGVGDPNPGDHPRSVDRDGRLGELEARIAQAETEGEQRSRTGGVEVAVADVDALAVVRVIGVAEIADGGVVLPGGPGGGEPAGGVGPAEQHIGEGVADGRAQLGEQEDVPDVLDGGQIDDTADVEDQQELLIALVQSEDVADLGIGEEDIAALGTPIAALARDAGEHVDRGDLVAGTLGALAAEGEVVLGLEHDGPHAVDDGGHAGGLGAGLDIGDEIGAGPLVEDLVGVQPRLGGQREAGFLQSLLNGYDMAGVDVARSGAALECAAGARAVQGQSAGPPKREGAVGSEQHHGFGCAPAHNGEVVGFIPGRLSWLDRLGRPGRLRR